MSRLNMRKVDLLVLEETLRWSRTGGQESRWRYSAWRQTTKPGVAPHLVLTGSGRMPVPEPPLTPPTDRGVRLDFGFTSHPEEIEKGFFSPGWRAASAGSSVTRRYTELLTAEGIPQALVGGPAPDRVIMWRRNLKLEAQPSLPGIN